VHLAGAKSHRAIWAASICLCLTGCVHNIPQAYSGQWVLRSSGKNMMILTTAVHRNKLEGVLTQPKHFTEGPDADFIGVYSPIVTRKVSGKQTHGVVQLSVGDPPDADHMRMKLLNPTHAALNWFHGQVPDLEFERVPQGQAAIAAHDWPAINMGPAIVSLRERLRVATEEDQVSREKNPIDPIETDRLSTEALPLIEDIFQRYGWPKISVFGPQAADNYWLLVQHQPDPIQERILPALEEAYEAGEARAQNYAYLFDRVQASAGRLQRWGTQSKCEHGRALLLPTEDIDALGERRKQMGLERISISLHNSDLICQRVKDTE